MAFISDSATETWDFVKSYTKQFTSAKLLKYASIKPAASEKISSDCYQSVRSTCLRL